MTLPRGQPPRWTHDLHQHPPRSAPRFDPRLPHRARVDTASSHFGPDAVVVDQDETFRDDEEFRDFLGRAGAELSYTTELVIAPR